MFRVGQKVVCVDAKFPIKHACDPVEGGVYTVSAVGVFAGFEVVALLEVDPPVGWLPWMKSIRFRPVVDRPTDISIFTRMLTDADEKVDA